MVMQMDRPRHSPSPPPSFHDTFPRFLWESVAELRHSSPMLLILISALMVILSRWNFLLFHAAVEGVAIVVGIMMCVVAWYSSRFTSNPAMVFASNGLFWAAILDFVHVMAYKGMGVFVTNGANEATQLWLIARYLQATALCLAPLALIRPVSRLASFAAFGSVATLLVGLILLGWFPAAYVEGQGLTAFKIINEYIIIAILLTALVTIWRHRDHVGTTIAPGLAAAILLSICAEMAFTVYINVYGLSNLIGHLFKLAALWVLFHSVVKAGLLTPYRALLAEITHRTAVELDLRRSNADLEAFVHVASHDLREPLRNISGYASLLDRHYAPQLDADARQFIGFIQTGASRLDHIMQSLVNFSRANRGDGPLTAFGFHDLLTETIAEGQESLAAARAHVTIPDDNPLVFGNRDMIAQILRHLLSNAVKYAHPDRETRIAVHWQDNADRLRITIADNGIGIPAEDRDRIFGIFQRVERGPLQNGHGIGLAVCRKVVEHHGGTIAVDDNPGGGCLFSFDLPLAQRPPGV